MKKKIEKFFLGKTIVSKVFLGCLICCIGIALVMRWNAARSFRSVAQLAVNERLGTDILQVIEEINGTEGAWSLNADGSVMIGNVSLGDGTAEKANAKGLISYFEKAGTYVNIYKKVDSQEGKYICVASSFVDSNGKDEVGTYLDRAYEKNIKADTPTTITMFFEGVENAGICKSILNEQGEEIGAIFLARPINEITGTSTFIIQRLTIFIAVGYTISFIVLMLIFSGWIRALKKADQYIQQVQSGDIPEEKLVIKTRDEMKNFADSINILVDGIREKQVMETRLNKMVEKSKQTNDKAKQDIEE